MKSTINKININFYKLNEEYQTNLNINLRDFGSEADYIKFWVPSTDLKKSFCNLIDALKETNNFEFIIHLDNSLSKEINVDYIKNIEKSIGNINIQKKNQDIYLDIKIDIENYDENFNTHFVLDSKVERKIKENQEFINFENDEINSNYINKIKSLEEIQNKLYDDHLETINKIIKDKNIILIKKEVVNLKLYYLIDKTSNLLVEAYHNNSEKNLNQKLLNYYCNYIRGLDIIEVSDHSVIYLEYLLREKNNKFQGGIIMPGRGGLIFDKINSINRFILKYYRENNNYSNLSNRNYPKISSYWKNLTDNERCVKIDEQIHYFIMNNSLLKDNIKLVRIERHIRIFVEVSNDLDDKALLLMMLEDLFKELEGRLEIFTTEIKDSNKLRWKNAPKSSIN